VDGGKITQVLFCLLNCFVNKKESIKKKFQWIEVMNEQIK